MIAPRLALFDLDGTLLDGDTDALWCDFLIDEGVLDRATFEPANRDVTERYAHGAISPEAFCTFYAATFAGRTPGEWRERRDRFTAMRIAPRIGEGARALVARHVRAGDRVVLTTATNRFLVEPIAARLLGIAELIATALEVDDSGAFTGRTSGVLNMGEGKVQRLREWFLEAGLDDPALAGATFYSDSMNDLPLLRAVGTPVAVDPDALLEAEATRLGWPILHLTR